MEWNIGKNKKYNGIMTSKDTNSHIEGENTA